MDIPPQFRRGPEFARLARKGEILVDRRPFPRVDLQRRQGGDPFDFGSSSPSSSSSSFRAVSTYSTVATPLPSTILAPSSSSGSSPASTATLLTAPAPTDEPLPRPFDTNLGSNFTSSSCPKFFNSFLNNSTFTSCLPLSLLLQNSNSFFTASKSLPAITATLNATCAVVFPTCSSLMSSLATQIKADSNCGADYRAQNPLVLQAYNGLVAYNLLYNAGCLKDNTTDDSNYCFANAITNTTSPSDSYIYYLPLGIALPGGATPTCSTCLQQTMNIFHAGADDPTEPVSADYVNAAQQIDLGCGPDFVNTTVPVVTGKSAAAAAGRSVPSLVLAALATVAVVVVGWWL
ncbi:hypothetical protein MMC08_003583 [Hypocenomyce scalaris]|nr:hypothetical protein [Hypocenomyce scalaris]